MNNNKRDPTDWNSGSQLAAQCQKSYMLTDELKKYGFTSAAKAEDNIATLQAAMAAMSGYRASLVSYLNDRGIEYEFSERREGSDHMPKFYARIRVHQMTNSGDGSSTKRDAYESVSWHTLSRLLDLWSKAVSLGPQEPPEMRDLRGKVDDLGKQIFDLSTKSPNISAGMTRRIDVLEQQVAAIQVGMTELKARSVTILAMLESIVARGDPRTVTASEWVIEKNPGPGEPGGRIVFAANTLTQQIVTNTLTTTNLISAGVLAPSTYSVDLYYQVMTTAPAVVSSYNAAVVQYHPGTPDLLIPPVTNTNQIYPLFVGAEYMALTTGQIGTGINNMSNQVFWTHIDEMTWLAGDTLKLHVNGPLGAAANTNFYATVLLSVEDDEQGWKKVVADNNNSRTHALNGNMEGTDERLYHLISGGSGDIFERTRRIEADKRAAKITNVPSVARTVHQLWATDMLKEATEDINKCETLIHDRGEEDPGTRAAIDEALVKSETNIQLIDAMNSRESNVSKADALTEFEAYLRNMLQSESTFNRYVFLTLIDNVEQPGEWAPYCIDEEFKPRTKPNSNGRKKGMEKQQDSGVGAEPVEPKKLSNVIDRILKKLKTRQDFSIWLITSNPKKDFARLIESKLNLTPGDMVANWFTDCWFDGTDDCIAAAGYATCIPAVAKAAKLPLWKEWFELEFEVTQDILDDWISMNESAARFVRRNIIDPVVNTVRVLESEAASNNAEAHRTNGNGGYSEMQARQHNALQHALNGNMAMFGVRDKMSDIKDMTPLRSVLVEKLSSDASINATKLIGAMSGLTGPEGVNSAFIPSQDAFRGQIVTAANAIVSPTQVDAPEAFLFPRQVRNGPASINVINAAIRTTWYGVGSTNWPSRKVAPSAMCTALAMAAKSSGGIRPSTQTLFGFRADDLNALGGVGQPPPVAGDCMLMPLLKLMLYYHSVSLAGNARFQPLGGACGKWDSFTQISNPPVVTLGYNTTPGVFGEACGGSTAVFPWGANIIGGGTGSISFHQDIASVPVDERANVAAIRAPDLLASESGNLGVNIALEAMSLAPYPCGIHTYQVGTLDNAGNNPTLQLYIPTSALIRMPGEDRIRILLPMMNARPIPTNQSQANDNMVMNPTSGPTATPALPAPNGGLNISFGPSGGAGFQPFNLAQYLYSWLSSANSPIDGVTIMRYAMRMADVTGRWSDFWAAWEMSCCLSNRYPQLNNSTVGNGALFTVNTFPGFDSQNYACLRPSLATVGFPAPDPNKWDFVIPGVSVQWKTQCVTGIIDPTPMGTNVTSPSADWITDPYAWQKSRYTARMYAIVMDFFYTSARLPALVWNNLFQNTVYEGIRATYKNLWIQTTRDHQVSDGGYVAPLGPALSLMMQTLLGVKPAVNSFGYTIFSHLNTPQGGTLAVPGNAFSGIYNTVPTEITNVVPQNLADIWLFMFVKKLPQGPHQWPTPLRSPTGIVTQAHSVIAFPIGGKSVPVLAKRQARSIGTRAVPEYDDAEVYNSRITWHGLGGEFFTTDGVSFALNIPLVNTIVCQKRIVPDFTMPNYVHSRVAVVNSQWIPAIEGLFGLNLVIGVAAAGPSDFMTQVMNGQAFAPLESFVWPERLVTSSTIIGGEITVGSWFDPLMKPMTGAEGKEERPV